jgi:hypothetical protein
MLHYMLRSEDQLSKFRLLYGCIVMVCTSRDLWSHDVVRILAILIDLACTVLTPICKCRPYLAHGTCPRVGDTRSMMGVGAVS